MPDPAETTNATITLGSIAWLAISTGLSTAVATTLIGWLKESTQERRKQTRVARTAALEIAAILTEFAVSCYVRRQENFNDEEQSTAIPAMAPVKKELGWTALRPDLAGSFNDLGLELQHAQVSINGTWDIVGPEEAIDAANQAFVELGLEAARLSERFRKAYGLPQYRPKASFDAIAALRERYRRQRPSALARGRSQIRHWTRKLKRIQFTSSDDL